MRSTPWLLPGVSYKGSSQLQAPARTVLIGHLTARDVSYRIQMYKIIMPLKNSEAIISEGYDPRSIVTAQSHTFSDLFCDVAGAVRRYRE